MDILTTIIVLIPSVLSLCVSGIYAYIALKKAKEPPKDEVWETAERMVCSKNGVYADEFADLYFQLKFLKDHPEDLAEYNSIDAAMKAKAQKRAGAQQSEPDSKQK